MRKFVILSRRLDLVLLKIADFEHERHSTEEPNESYQALNRAAKPLMDISETVSFIIKDIHAFQSKFVAAAKPYENAHDVMGQFIKYTEEYLVPGVSTLSALDKEWQDFARLIVTKFKPPQPETKQPPKRRYKKSSLIVSYKIPEKPILEGPTALLDAAVVYFQKNIFTPLKNIKLPSFPHDLQYPPKDKWDRRIYIETEEFKKYQKSENMFKTLTERFEKYMELLEGMAHRSQVGLNKDKKEKSDDKKGLVPRKEKEQTLEEIY